MPTAMEAAAIAPAKGIAPDAIPVDAKRRTAVRKSTDRSDRGDPLMLHRFETIFSIAEMINVNREVDDDDEDSARQAAEDTPELTIGSNKKRPATRLKLDIDLAPREADTRPLTAEFSYPESDWKRQTYHRDYCRVMTTLSPEERGDWAPDIVTQRNIRHVRRQFEALRPRRQIIHASPTAMISISPCWCGTSQTAAPGRGEQSVSLPTRGRPHAISRSLS